MKINVKISLTALVAVILNYLVNITNTMAQDQTPFQLLSDQGAKYLGAALSIGLAGLGAGIGLGTTGAAAIGAISEKPEMLGRALIFVVLVETIAIYGLLISLLIFFL